MSKCDLVRSVDQRATLSQEGDHLSISLAMWRSVVWLANEKQWARPAGALPSSPWATAIAEPGIISKTGHERAIELKRSLKVADPHKDM
jgi:hypothetical protein